MTAPDEKLLTFAEWLRVLDDMPTCSMKYRLLDGLYSGRIAVAPAAPKAVS